MKREFFGRSNAKAWTAAAVTAAFFVPLGVFGAPALAKSAASASQEYAGASQYQYKVLLCHKTGSKKHPLQTISISRNALPAHLKHGDTEGACPTAPPQNGKDKGKGDDNGGTQTTATPTQPAPTNGDDNGKGNGHGKGKGNGK